MTARSSVARVSRPSSAGGTSGALPTVGGRPDEVGGAGRAGTADFRFVIRDNGARDRFVWLQARRTELTVIGMTRDGRLLQQGTPGRAVPWRTARASRRVDHMTVNSSAEANWRCPIGIRVGALVRAGAGTPGRDPSRSGRAWPAVQARSSSAGRSRCSSTASASSPPSPHGGRRSRRRSVGHPARPPRRGRDPVEEGAPGSRRSRGCRHIVPQTLPGRSCLGTPRRRRPPRGGSRTPRRPVRAIPRWGDRGPLRVLRTRSTRSGSAARPATTLAPLDLVVDLGAEHPVPAADPEHRQARGNPSATTRSRPRSRSQARSGHRSRAGRAGGRNGRCPSAVTRTSTPGDGERVDVGGI